MPRVAEDSAARQRLEDTGSPEGCFLVSLSAAHAGAPMDSAFSTMAREASPQNAGSSCVLHGSSGNGDQKVS